MRCADCRRPDRTGRGVVQSVFTSSAGGGTIARSRTSGTFRRIYQVLYRTESFCRDNLTSCARSAAVSHSIRSSTASSRQSASAPSSAASPLR
jgi:hypothetical protein